MEQEHGPIMAALVVAGIWITSMLLTAAFLYWVR